MNSTTQGISRAYQYRPSDDRLGNAPYVHGPLQPMQTQRSPWWLRFVGRG